MRSKSRYLSRHVHRKPIRCLVTLQVTWLPSPTLPAREVVKQKLTPGSHIVVEPLGSGISTYAGLICVHEDAEGPRIIVSAATYEEPDGVMATLIAIMVPCVPRAPQTSPQPSAASSPGLVAWPAQAGQAAQAEHPLQASGGWAQHENAGWEQAQWGQHDTAIDSAVPVAQSMAWRPVQQQGDWGYPSAEQLQQQMGTMHITNGAHAVSVQTPDVSAQDVDEAAFEEVRDRALRCFVARVSSDSLSLQRLELWSPLDLQC
jgi:hypothetical protein